MSIEPNIEAIRAQIRRRARNVTEEQLLQLTGLLPPGSKERDHFRSQFLLAAARHWARLPTWTPQEKDHLKAKARAVKSQLKKLRSLMVSLSEPANHSRYAFDVISTEIASMKRIEEVLEDDLNIYLRSRRDGLTRPFVFDMLQLWKRHGGAVVASRVKGKPPSGDTIKFLQLACDIVMGEATIGSEALVKWIWKYPGGPKGARRGA